MNIQEHLQFKPDKPAILALRNSDQVQVVSIGLLKGQILKKHLTDTPALIVVLQGRIAFDMEGHITELPALSTFDIPPAVPHEVKGLEESIFLLIKEKA